MIADWHLDKSGVLFFTSANVAFQLLGRVLETIANILQNTIVVCSYSREPRDREEILDAFQYGLQILPFGALNPDVVLSTETGILRNLAGSGGCPLTRL